MSNFGYNPADSSYYFEVEVAKAITTIWEVYDHPKIKAYIPASIWRDLADPIKAEWNMRLKKYEQRPGKWAAHTKLDRLFGKELTLLAWALEEVSPDLVERVVKNWKGFAPEERWWLYTTINATSNLPTFGKDRGWRKAIRIAFSEN